MSDSEIEAKVAKFIARHIRSVAELEALLLLSVDSQKCWTPDEFSQALRFNPSYAESLLTNLVNQNLAIRQNPSGKFCLSPDYAGETSILKDLAAVYQAKRISVIQMIYDFQSGALQDFAQAFKLRK